MQQRGICPNRNTEPEKREKRGERGRERGREEENLDIIYACEVTDAT
jgi:hypothetical protein